MCYFYTQGCLVSQERFASAIKSTTEIADRVRSYRCCFYLPGCLLPQECFASAIKSTSVSRTGSAPTGAVFTCRGGSCRRSASQARSNQAQKSQTRSAPAGVSLNVGADRARNTLFDLSLFALHPGRPILCFLPIRFVKQRLISSGRWHRRQVFRKT